MAHGYDEQFGTQYVQFLKWAEDGVRRGLRVEKTDYEASAEERSVASRMLHAVFDELLDPDWVSLVAKAAGDEMSVVGQRALGLELEYLAGGTFRAGEAKTAKDSLEKLLGRKLPKKIRDLLDILNEILRIVSGRGDESDDPDAGQ